MNLSGCMEYDGGSVRAKKKCEFVRVNGKRWGKCESAENKNANLSG